MWCWDEGLKVGYGIPGAVWATDLGVSGPGCWCLLLQSINALVKIGFTVELRSCSGFMFKLCRAFLHSFALICAGRRPITSRDPNIPQRWLSKIISTNEISFHFVCKYVSCKYCCASFLIYCVREAWVEAISVFSGNWHPLAEVND